MRPAQLDTDGMTTAAELYEQALQAFRTGDSERSRELNEESLRVARAAGDAVGQAMATIGLCRLAFREGDHVAGRRLAREARELAVDNPNVEVRAVHMEAEMLRAEGRYVEAVPLYEQNIERWRGIHDEHGVTMEMYNLGSVLALAGEPERASVLLRQALERASDAGDRSLQTYCVAGIGAACVSRDPERALRLMAAARAAGEQAREVFDPAEDAEFRRFEADAEAKLGADAATAARAAGARMPLDAARVEALAG